MKRVAILDVNGKHALAMRDIVYAADTRIINVSDDFPAGIREAIASDCLRLLPVQRITGWLSLGERSIGRV